MYEYVTSPHTNDNALQSATPKEVPNPTSTSVAAGLDYEAVTLMRLRQAERERLEREIREQEEKE